MHKWLALALAALLCLVPLYVHAQDAVTPESSDSPADTIELTEENHAAAEKNAPLKLLGTLYEKQNMLVYSPLSLSVALGMTAEGAAGETRTQIEEFLGERRPDWMVLEDLMFSDVHLANTVFLREDIILRDEYIDALDDEYDAEPVVMNTGNVKEQVNQWVSEHTNGMIEQMLTEEPNAMTAMLLVNALHLYSEWESPFDAMNTGFSIFHAPEGDIEVSSMRQTTRFAYKETEGVQSVALPYRNSMLELLVLLPEDGDIQKLIDEMCVSPDKFILKYEPSESARVRLSLPVIMAESSLSLNDALIAAGVTDAFDDQKADFSAMTENADQLGLHIGSVLQKTVLNINETGTEAAASTVIGMMAMSARPETPVEMTVDRPFMLLLRDAGSGYVLFAACINNPA